MKAAEVLEPATPESLSGEPLVAAALAMKALAKVEQEHQAAQTPVPLLSSREMSTELRPPSCRRQPPRLWLR